VPWKGAKIDIDYTVIMPPRVLIAAAQCLLIDAAIAAHVLLAVADTAATLVSCQPASQPSCLCPLLRCIHCPPPRSITPVTRLPWLHRLRRRAELPPRQGSGVWGRSLHGGQGWRLDATHTIALVPLVPVAPHSQFNRTKSAEPFRARHPTTACVWKDHDGTF
jgi:hypothetical protein